MSEYTIHIDHEVPVGTMVKALWYDSSGTYYAVLSCGVELWQENVRVEYVNPRVVGVRNHG